MPPLGTSAELAKLKSALFSQLAAPFTGEELFDCLPDLVFFVKNQRGEYVVVNQTLVERCACREKSELLGRRADELFPAPFGESYRAQDECVIRQGRAILNQLELHFYASRGRGWCLTNKLPLRDRHDRVIGLIGVSKDLQTAVTQNENYAAIARAVQRIQEDFGDNLRVAELAREAGLSGYQFEQRIRKTFQLTPGQLIQKTRMEAALQRLRESDVSIAEVALSCGYSDQSAFTRKFRQTIGISPSAYRTRHGMRASRSSEG